MGLFGNDTKLREEDRIYRIKIRERLLDIPGLFDSKTSKIIDKGLCAPKFKVTSSTIEIDRKIDELSENIASIETDVPDVKKLFQGTLVEMFAFRNDEKSKSKGKEYEQMCTNWELDAKINITKIELENLKKQRAELDPNDSFFNMKKDNLEKEIKSKADSFKRLLEAKYQNKIYSDLLDKADLEKFIEKSANFSPKEFEQNVNNMRKKLVKDKVKKNRINDLYNEYLNMLDDSDN